MFVDFLYELRRAGVRVGAQEALALAAALDKNLHATSLDLIRSVLPATKGIRLVGVTLSNFNGRDSDGDEDPGAPQHDLLDFV